MVCTQDIECIWSSLKDRVQGVVDMAISAAADAAAVDTLTKMLDGLRSNAQSYTSKRYPICGPNRSAVFSSLPAQPEFFTACCFAQWQEPGHVSRR